MDYTRWSELHLNPAPPPLPQPPPQPNPNPSHSSYFAYYHSPHLHPHTSNPNPPTTSLGVQPHSGVPLPPQPLFSYYSDPNAHTWTATDTVYAGACVTEQLTTTNPNSIFVTNPTALPKGNGTWKKQPKKAKIVQSAYCEVCGVDCNSKDILEQHKLGKKHKKKLEKLKAANYPASAQTTNPVIGPPDNPNKSKAVSGQKMKKNTAEALEDLETKRRKVVQGGAAIEAVRTCALCNVVCNSQTVFHHHIAGQKHAAMLRKYATEAGVGTVT